MTAPHRRIRTTHGPKPPVRVGLAYAEALRAWLAPMQARVLAAVLEGARHIGPAPRTDARTREPMRAVRVIVTETPPPTAAIDAAAVATDRANAADMARVGRVVGVPIRAVTPPNMVDVFRAQNLALIRSLGEDEIAQIDAILSDAQDAGLHAGDLSSLLQDRFGVAQSRANLIAADQTLKLNGQLTEYRQTEAGITAYVWTTSGDERVRPLHADLEGTEQAWASPPVTTDDGERNAPGGDIRCRCTAFPVVDL